MMKCVVRTEKTAPQGTIGTGYPRRAIPFEWNAAPGADVAEGSHHIHRLGLLLTSYF